MIVRGVYIRVDYVGRYCFFFQAEDGIRDLVRSRGLGDVYKRQQLCTHFTLGYGFVAQKFFEAQNVGVIVKSNALALSLIHI